MGGTMKAIGYVRVSLPEQAAEGVSLDAQDGKIKAYCALHDLELVKILRDEGFSAGDLERPGMLELLSLIRKREVDVLITWRLDRLTRSVKDLITLLDMLGESHIELASVTEHFDTSNAVGRLMLHLLVSIGQWERETVGERTKASLHYLRSSSRVYGRLAYGFLKDGDRLIPFQKEMTVVKKIYQWRKDGLSYLTIAKRLNDRKVATKTGRKARWYASGVRYILKNRALYRSHVQAEAAVENRVRAAVAAKPRS